METKVSKLIQNGNQGFQNELKWEPQAPPKRRLLPGGGSSQILQICSNLKDHLANLNKFAR